MNRCRIPIFVLCRVVLILLYSNEICSARRERIIIKKTNRRQEVKVRMNGILTGVYLFPHPPIMIPEIGGAETSKCGATVNGARAAAAALAAGNLDTVIIVSPHGTMFRDGPCFLDGERLLGDFGQFGCPQIRFLEGNDTDTLSLITEELKKDSLEYVCMDDGIAARYHRERTLDHGFMVPFYFIREAWKSGQVISITYGFQNGNMQYRVGRAVRRAIDRSGKRIAFVCSGDMSHRLKNTGNYSFDPMGPVFDRDIEKMLRAGAWDRIVAFDLAISEPAGECALRSLQMTAGVLGEESPKVTIYSHEGPFGVGYLTGSAALAVQDPLCALARSAVEAHVIGEREIAVPEDQMLTERRACFVTLHESGQLRGCIGTILPCAEDLTHEIISNAFAASSEDPRFAPVTREELPYLVYSVDVLSQPEDIEGIDQLDPGKYGVIVSCGNRRGLLLPDLKGVDTVQKQVEIARQKGGIGKDEAYRLSRFTVVRHQ